LGDEKFAVRNRAAKALAAAGDEVKAALEAAQTKLISDEARAQIDRLLKSLQAGTSASVLRPVRVVEVLDRLGTPDARKLLEEMATQPYGDAAKFELERILKKTP
jgi:HEAT repeat protein